MDKIFNEIIKIGDLVFDVGLNTGDKSNEFLNLGAKVVGFEPQIQCYNYAMNRLGDNGNFSAENIALDKSVGVGKIFISNAHTISSMSQEFITESSKERFSEYRWDEGIDINTDTLDNMISKYGTPKFIKIDVEGYEINVLGGLSKPIEYISIEFTPEICSKTLDCIEYVNNLNENKTLYNYRYRNDVEFKYNNWITREEMEDYLKSITDYKFEFGDVYMKKN